jgi:hypothetical protein
MAHTNCMLDKQGYMHARACTRPRAGERKRTLTHTRTHSHTHTHKYVIFIAFSRQRCFANGAQCYAIGTLPVSLLWLSFHSPIFLSKNALRVIIYDLFHITSRTTQFQRFQFSYFTATSFISVFREKNGVFADWGTQGRELKLSNYRPWAGPWGSRRLRLQNFQTIGT